MKQKIRIKWKIFIYMLAFTVAMIALLWIFQTVYLEDFYKSIKMNEVDNAIENLSSVINDEDLDEAIDTIASNYDISLAIIRKNGVITHISGDIDENYVSLISVMKRTQFIKETISKGEVLTVKDYFFSDEVNMKPEDMGQGVVGPSHYDEFYDRYKKPDNRYDRMPNMPMQVETSSVLKIKAIDNSEGEEVYIFAYSIISPVGATIQTLRIQLICISVIMIILAFALALFISWRVSKPIVEINSTAKKMSKGNYDINYHGEGYLEVAELAETLNNTAIELGKAETLQRELIANVSHDLRTPLTMITAYSEVMRDIPGENTPENTQVIIDEAARLSLLVNDLLDISKLQAGVSQYDMKEYNLTESIRSVIDRIQKLVQNEGYKINFISNNEVYVNADEYKIYQVIYNLVNNAITYSEENKTITVQQINQGNIVRIEVIDKGKGIAKDQLHNVWDRYYKVDKNHKRALSGTGLGLSIVKNILSGHNARYGVISKENEGSTFWFELKTL